ncbi:AbiH family protein, partial [Ligilactobacillus aviarius]
MTINNADQLIIIGNGFDLHCGLKTSFKDYFTFKKKEILRKLISIGKEPLEDLDNLYDKSTLNKLNYNLHYANDEIINSDFI